MVMEPDSPAVPAKLITFKVLPTLKERQQQHGLRHSDYLRYHGYCSRRLRRLRQTLRMPQGDKKHFKRKDVTLEDIDSDKEDTRYLEIPLTLAERAWSYALALKQDSNTEPRKKFHSVCRLQKARDHANVLFELAAASVRLDARTKLECEAYAAWMNASFLFQLQEWNEAIEYFKKAQSIYTQIAAALGEHHPEASIYSDKTKEIIPSLRFCAYQTGEKLDISELSVEFQSAAVEALISQKPKMSEVVFRKTKIGIPDGKLPALLVRIDELEKRTEKTVEMYENILVDLRDGIQMVRDLINTEKEQGLKRTPLLNYLLYLRLSLTNSRTELMLEEKSKPLDSLRLLDMIVHNWEEMRALPSLQSDDEFQAQADGLAHIYKGRRCLYLADILKAQKKWDEAYGLYGRSREHLDRGVKDLGKDSEALKTLNLDELNNKILHGECECRARAVLENSGEGDEFGFSSPSEPLIDRLDQFVLDESLTTKKPNIINFPSEMKAIPCKPLFFDLSGNSVSVNVEEIEKLAGVKSKTSPAKEGTSAGLTGFVKGLWGWGK